jgi:flavin reductase (DIM6/NTAB) family NADH-FMN oxidoreductase RutF
MNLRQLLRPLFRPLPLWEPIGLAEPQQLVDVRLDTEAGERDVTANHVVVSLQPLLLAVGGPVPSSATLRFIDRVSGRELGALRLRRERIVTLDRTDVGIYAVTSDSHACLPVPLRHWQQLLHAVRQRRGHDFSMSNAAVRQLNVFYVCPRPVVLISVDDGEANNLFPMDLIGPLEESWFSLALRRTSPSVKTLRRAKRLALGDVDACDRDLAYRLGRHHGMQRIDWAEVGCELAPSATFGLPLPTRVTRTRECIIEHSLEMGSHAWFLCRVVNERGHATGARLFHTSGIHRRFRERGPQLPWSAPSGASCS